MQEFEVGPGRKLVGVDMGKGNQRYNSPRGALKLLETTLDNLQAQLFDQADPPGLLTKEELHTLQALQERSNTAYLEIAWLRGGPEAAQRILDIEQRHRTQRIIRSPRRMTSRRTGDPLVGPYPSTFNLDEVVRELMRPISPQMNLLQKAMGFP